MLIEAFRFITQLSQALCFTMNIALSMLPNSSIYRISSRMTNKKQPLAASRYGGLLFPP